MTLARLPRYCRINKSIKCVLIINARLRRYNFPDASAYSSEDCIFMSR